VQDRIPEVDAAWDAVAADPGMSAAPYWVYNIGNNKPVDLPRLLAITSLTS
jgi:UDP-glucuronate 4-epimerase